MMILSTTRKIHAIAAALSNHPIGVDPADLGEPWSRYLQWINNWIDTDPDHVDLVQLRLDFMTYCHENGDDDRHNFNLIREAVDHPVKYQSTEEILETLPDTKWLWKNWIPLGMISILAATSGTGKSYVALDIARRVINDGKFPDGSQVLKPGPVIYVDAEYTDTLYKNRVGVWSPAERRQIFYMQADPDRFVLDLDAEDDRDRFLDHICVIHPSLVMVDSYGSATSSGTNKKQDVQGLLAFLARIARDHELAILLIHHIRKNPGGTSPNDQVLTLDSILGSFFITAMARNVLGMQLAHWWHKDGPRRLWVMKSSGSQYAEPLGVTFKTHPQNSEVAQLEYGAPPEVEEESTKTTECENWLLEILREEGEPVKPKAILELGELEGYNQRMIYRVRKRLNGRIRDTAGRFNPDNCWEIVPDGDDETKAEDEAASPEEISQSPNDEDDVRVVRVRESA